MSLPLGGDARASVAQDRGEGIRPCDAWFPARVARRLGMAADDPWDVDGPPERRIARDAHRHTRVCTQDLHHLRNRAPRARAKFVRYTAPAALEERHVP